MPKPHKYRELIKLLRGHDARFEFYLNRGKGSHRVIYHPDISGRAVAFPVKCHGEGTEIGLGAIGDIVRRFNLPKDLL